MGIFKHLVLTGSLLLVAVPGMANQTFSSDKADFRLETVAQNLEHPWSLAFMPDGSMLVTEREGELRMIRNGSLVNDPISGVPELVVSGQGGLLDVILHPDFEQNQVLFLSYAHRNRDGMTTRVARARLSGDRLTDVEVIFEALPRSGGGRHFAGRMEFDRDGTCTWRWATGERWTGPRTILTMPEAYTGLRPTVAPHQATRSWTPAASTIPFTQPATAIFRA